MATLSPAAVPEHPFFEQESQPLWSALVPTPACFGAAPAPPRPLAACVPPWPAGVPLPPLPGVLAAASRPPWPAAASRPSWAGSARPPPWQQLPRQQCRPLPHGVLGVRVGVALPVRLELLELLEEAL
eukprot:10550147-Lingulodinium_polyedra.AAC.1